MRRTAILVTTVAILLAAFSGAALATSEPISRFVGTAGADSIRGTAQDDVLEGHGGDALHGLAGDDTLWGGCRPRRTLRRPRKRPDHHGGRRERLCGLCLPFACRNS